MFDFCTWCSWTWVMKIRQDNIYDSPLDSQARHLYICIHRCAKEKKGIGMLWLRGEEASQTMVV